MFCAKCRNDLASCTCPDIEERLRALQQPGTHVHIPDCPACGKPRPICKCGYADYHRKVVDACAALMGEESREFFDRECTFEEEFRAGETPEEVAEAQRDAL